MLLDNIRECFRIMMRSEYLLGMLLWAGIDQVRDLIVWIRNLLWSVMTTNVRLSKRETRFLKSYLNSTIVKLLSASSCSLRRLDNKDDQKYSLGPDTYFGSWMFHQGYIPRKYGVIPENLGQYVRLCPGTKLHSKFLKLLKESTSLKR